MAPPPQKLAVVVPVTLLALLGAVAGQISNAPSASAPVSPPSLSPASSSPISYPPSSNPPTYPPSQSPLSSDLSPTYSPSPSPSPSQIPTNSQPIPSQISYPPSQSPLGSIPPTYSPGPSPLRLIPPTYPPSNSPSPATYPPNSISAPPTYPPSANQPLNPSPSPSPTTYAPSISPTTSPSPIPTAYPPTVSPSPSISIPPTYSPSASPSPSILSPPTYSPSVSPSPSISSPPTHSPSASPSPSMSSSPTYPPSASPVLSPSITSPPTGSPSPTPASSISIPPAFSPIQSPSPSPSSAPSGLSVGYYKYLCPNAETIVRAAVKSAIDSNPGTGAGLIRLFFHDCFVQGCDASVLLNTTGSSQPTERASAPNLSLRGFEVIDAAKAALEAFCPGVVSCADIVAFAGRDATFFLSGSNAVDFDMPAGRYDGRVSLDSEALANLPPPLASLETLKEMFAAKGLDTDDMVTLSGAHTVGRAHCSSFSDRLPPNASDMNATLSTTLTSQCGGGGGGGTTVPQDSVTPDGLDSQYYRNVLNHEVLFASDAALLASNQTAGMVSDNAFTPGLWETKFKAAMVKMGGVGIKTRANGGEIRDKCWMVNN